VKIKFLKFHRLLFSVFGGKKPDVFGGFTVT
jgi:hypothetical protein